MYNVLVKIKKHYLILFGIILLAAFFRFYNFRELQYWDLDDEVFTSVMRHIVFDKSPTLLVPNAFLEFGQGPYFHWIMALFYALTKFDLVTVRVFSSLLGIATTLLVYITARSIGGGVD